MSTKIKKGIYRNIKFDEPSELLKDNIFKTYAKLLCFSAYVGLIYKKNKTLKTSDRVNDPVSERVFENTSLLDHIYTVAYIYSDNPRILDDQTSCFEIFESLANGGIEYIHGLLQDNPTDTDGVEVLMTMVKKIHSKNLKEISI